MTAVFAHRGCTEGFTENTIEAFAEARRLGADGVELDVRLTADGALAIHHDAEIPGIGTIDQLEVADLPAQVPLLADVLAVCEGMVVNVEIKNAPQDPGWDSGEAVAALTAAAIEEAGWTARRHRLLLPDGHAARSPGRRRPPGPRGVVGLRRRGRAGAGGGGRGGVRRRPPVRGVGGPGARRAGARNGTCGQRLDGQRPRRPARHGGRRGGHRDHRPARARRWSPRVAGPAERPGGPTTEAGSLGKGACHRAEWR